LSKDHLFATGAVSPEFVEAFRKHINEAWQPVVAGGVHECEFCAPRADGRFIGSGSNLWVPGDGVVYVAPALILHYIEAPVYRPPEGFIAAVLDCPKQRSEAYRNRMQKFSAWWVEFLEIG